MLAQLTVLHFMNQGSLESNTLLCKCARLSHPPLLNDWYSGCFFSSLLFSKLKCSPGFIQTNFHSKCNDGLYPAFLTSWHKLRIPVILRSHDCIIIPLRALPYPLSAPAETFALISPTFAFFFLCLLHSPSPCQLKQAEWNVLERQLS